MSQALVDHRRFATLTGSAVANPVGVEQGAVYTIVGPDGVRAVINDPTDRDFIGYLTQPPSGLERAGVRENADSIPEADGGIHGAFRYDRLAFTLQGIIAPDATATAGETGWTSAQVNAVHIAKLMRATNAMRADSVLSWKPSQAPRVAVSFRQQQPTRVADRRPKSFIVAGVCEDPLVYTEQVSTAQVVGVGNVDAQNIGSADVWPTFTIYGPVTNPTITDITNGGSIVLNGSIAADHYWVIDTNPRRRSIRDNDILNVYAAFTFASSTWLDLPALTTTTFALGGSATGATTQLVVQWRSAWS